MIKGVFSSYFHAPVLDKFCPKATHNAGIALPAPFLCEVTPNHWADKLSATLTPSPLVSPTFDHIGAVAPLAAILSLWPEICLVQVDVIQTPRSFGNQRIMRTLIKCLKDSYINREPLPRSCADIASELEVSDYEIFMRAYQWYFGNSPASIDKEFKDYLLSGCETLPFYVTQFLREWHPGTLVA